MKTVYIFGHKSPDTDSVSSAIALAYLRNKLGGKSVPKVIGPLNRETRFVLDFFNVPAPSYLNDVRMQIRDVNYSKNVFVDKNDSIETVFNKMKEKGLTAIPIVNNNQKLTGYVSLENIIDYLINKNGKIKTNLNHLVSILNAKIINNTNTNFEGNILVNKSPDKGSKDIVIADSNLDHLINKNINLLIIANNISLNEGQIKKIKENKLNVIVSNMTVLEISKKIVLTNYINNIKHISNPKTINVNSYYTDFLSLSKKANYNNYPVVKDSGVCLGVLKLSDIRNYEKKQVILVDHNNYEQSIDGLEEAEILEIFDHHNLGNIGTTMPIYFNCRPVGSTATIIYDSYKKEKIVPPREIAGLMLSAILSDTLLLTSPTTTYNDITATKELANIAGLDYKKYGMQMLKAASSIKGLSVSELISQDFKTYTVNNKIYGISVITSMDFDIINKDIDKYIERLNEMSKKEFEGVLLFITDVVMRGSYVIYNNDSENLLKNAFNLKNIKEGYFLEGIISRKKQILPALLKELEK